ncbi:Transcriptional regulatory protein WalR [Dyadobacter sp. CECT 9275]|uniref:Transcriptional regulatory protein WalR n=1 Tax=Dyadobacter helix TaxID=2822344 RepID=A0A916NK28_9BACT|nr:response regulator [Dyadobacter sp. CECT 9275]CAG4992550.1 Transcriptional regulatory protein WalR [Dyadobacter sp. CECT 9275]
MSKKILIVEDEPDIIELLKIVFRDTGYNLTFSRTELEIEYIRELNPDLIVMDVTIRGSLRSGSQICRELKADQQIRNVPVILCSGEYNLKAIANDCGADMYLPKPFDISSLLFHVDKFLS